jgi:hypothetical protein
LVSYSGNFHAFFWHNSCNLFLYIGEVDDDDDDDDDDDGSSFLRERVSRVVCWEWGLSVFNVSVFIVINVLTFEIWSGEYGFIYSD